MLASWWWGWGGGLWGGGGGGRGVLNAQELMKITGEKLLTDANQQEFGRFLFCFLSFSLKIIIARTFDTKPNIQRLHI